MIGLMLEKSVTGMIESTSVWNLDLNLWIEDSRLDFLECGNYLVRFCFDPFVLLLPKLKN